jgi:hypothetical protein
MKKSEPDPKLFEKSQFKILFLANQDKDMFEDFFEQFKNTTNFRFTMTDPDDFHWQGKRKERYDAVFFYYMRGSCESLNEMLLEEDARTFLGTYLNAPVAFLGLDADARRGYK